MNSERLLGLFTDLVVIESPSWHETAMAALCSRELESMGFSVTVDDSAEKTGSEVGNLIAHLPGTTPGHIAFSAHMDTVVPCAGIKPVVVREMIDGEEVEVIRSAGETILSADDKAGIAAIFEGVRSTLEANAPRPDITVLLTTCEEQSLLGASALAPDVFEPTNLAASHETYETNVSRETLPTSDERHAEDIALDVAQDEMHDAMQGGTQGEVRGGGQMQEGDQTKAYQNLVANHETNVSRETSSAASAPVPCFVLDADGHPGSIILGAPFHYTLRARFSGRTAHAGVEPEAGVSAIQMAAHAVSSMALGRIDECTTANVGVVKGGAAVNIVPDECWVEGECRSLYEDRVNAQRDAMTRACRAAAAHFGGSVDVDWTIDYPGILFGEDDPIVQHLVRAVEAAGLAPKFAISGGGADANVLSAKGACAITLGIGMTNFHTTSEFISVRDLEDSVRLVESLIAEYAR